MQYKKYDAYKDSEAPWIGTVPSHWDVKKIGQCFQHRKEKVSDKDFEPLSVTMQGIVPQLETAAKSDSGDDRKKVCVGDFVINSRSDRKGSSGVSPLDGSVSLISIILKPLAHDKGYIHHLLRSFEFQEEFYRNGKGIVADLWSTKYSDMKNIKVPLPSIEEQKAIAEFIDKKTSQIDTHINKQERLIALLKEQRTAIINKAVTRGLDENVKLKDSGIDWLGEIPKHWRVKKIKHFSYTKGRIGFHGLKSDEFLYDNGAYLITGTDFINGNINWSSCRRVTEKRYREDENIHIRNNDLLITKDGTIGKTAIVTDMPYKTTLNSGVLLVRTQQTICKTQYLYWIVNSYIFKRFIDLKNAGTTIKHLYQNDFNNFWISLPSLHEQEEIINSCNHENDEIEKAIITIEKEIASLKEYRQSLISNAVTGKIRVI